MKTYVKPNMDILIIDVNHSLMAGSADTDVMDIGLGEGSSDNGRAYDTRHHFSVLDDDDDE